MRETLLEKLRKLDDVNEFYKAYVIYTEERDIKGKLEDARRDVMKKIKLSDVFPTLENTIGKGRFYYVINSEEYKVNLEPYKVTKREKELLVEEDLTIEVLLNLNSKKMCNLNGFLRGGAIPRYKLYINDEKYIKLDKAKEPDSFIVFVPHINVHAKGYFYIDEAILCELDSNLLDVEGVVVNIRRFKNFHMNYTFIIDKQLDEIHSRSDKLSLSSEHTQEFGRHNVHGKKKFFGKVEWQTPYGVFITQKKKAKAR
ncbi:MAG: hypothetical protein J7K22_04720 [Nanoarchaeota archaeon]|nr:hypothetical protein [Nanoarchaeota archaeon]